MKPKIHLETKDAEKMSIAALEDYAQQQNFAIINKNLNLKKN
jgi:hypothetical protein